MRKLNISLWLLCLFTAMPFGAKAQSTRTYMFNFHKNDFTVETLNGDTCFLSSTKYELSSEFDPTLPELPVIYVNLLLPSDSTYASFSYVDITKPFGNVVVSSGKSLNLKANKEIEIRNSLEVKTGAEFSIDIEP